MILILTSIMKLGLHYVKFCVDSVIPLKKVKRFLSNKPYITKEVKECLNQKKLAFKQKDLALIKLAQRKLNQKIREARRSKINGDKINSDLSKNPKKLWSKLRCTTNIIPKRISMHTANDETLANELNEFDCRFDVNSYDCSDVLEAVRIDDSVSKPQISLDDVVRAFIYVLTLERQLGWMVFLLLF